MLGRSGPTSTGTDESGDLRSDAIGIRHRSSMRLAGCRPHDPPGHCHKSLRRKTLASHTLAHLDYISAMPPFSCAREARFSSPSPSPRSGIRPQVRKPPQGAPTPLSPANKEPARKKTGRRPKCPCGDGPDGPFSDHPVWPGVVPARRGIKAGRRASKKTWNAIAGLRGSEW